MNKYDIRHPVTNMRVFACVFLLLLVTMLLLVLGAYVDLNYMDLSPAVLGIGIAILDTMLAKVLVSKFILKD